MDLVFDQKFKISNLPTSRAKAEEPPKVPKRGILKSVTTIRVESVRLGTDF